MHRTHWLRLALAPCLLALGGCMSRYAVRDTSTNRTYYTREVTRGPDRYITLMDERSGEQVTIRDGDVKRITRRQFEAGVQGRPDANIWRSRGF